MSDTLDELAYRYGIATSYHGLDGRSHIVPEATKIRLLAAMGVAVATEDEVVASLARAPTVDAAVFEPPADTACYLPPHLEAGRDWGIAIQLYALRSERNWGIGDFADLAAFARIAAAAGADFVGLNPLHASFLADPQRRSPFFPSNRRFLNPLYIAVDQVPGFAGAMADRDGIEAARAAELVDYPTIAELKLSALGQARAAWRAADGLPETYGHAAYAAFREAEGEALRLHALFEALSARMVRHGFGSGWESWPLDYQDAGGAAVAAFAADESDEVDFHIWLQWLASVQLSAARAAAHAAGMRVGLYLDFAVGEAPDGSATWGRRDLTLAGIQVGAPPDYFSATGQDWGLAPLSSAALRGAGIEDYRAMIAANMRYAGALRIDHVMGVRQLFVIPRGERPSAGTYVRYPTANMLGALASASHAHSTIVIGEDLGNVPEGFRDMMERAGMLSYRILYFERHHGGFHAPAHYPRSALACMATHDLPVLESWWWGRDIDVRLSHGLIGELDAAEQRPYRAEERRQLFWALVHAGLVDRALAPRLADGVDGKLPLPAEVMVAVHRFLARTPCRLLAARIEDLCGQTEPVNVPGTVDAYPNWRLKLGTALEKIAEGEVFRQVTVALRGERPRI